MRTETDAREELFEHTKIARNQLLNALDSKPDTYEEPTTERLIGNCPRNAVVLLNELSDTWNHGSVELRTGAIDTGRVELFPDDISPSNTYWDYLKDHGMIHYWVEATDATLDTTFYCEIAADRRFSGTVFAHSPTGYPFVHDELPKEYVSMNATYTPTELSNGDCPHNLLVLWQSVWNARQRLLKERGANELTSEVLDGNCHLCTETLLEELSTAWNTSTDDLFGEYASRADCYAQFGAIATDEHPASTFKTRLDVERKGTDHFWVEAVDISRDTYYVLDCFSNDPKTYGQPFVMASHPESYVPVSDGRFPIEAVFSSEVWWRSLT